MSETVNPHYCLTPEFHLSTGLFDAAIDPATLDMVGNWVEATQGEIEAVLLRVTRASKWKRSMPSRAPNLAPLGQSDPKQPYDRLRHLMSREMGKPYPEAIGAVANCASIFRYYAEMARDEVGKVAGTTQAGPLQYARYQPYGVSAHIMPFNFPILLMWWTVAASLRRAMGGSSSPQRRRHFETLEFMKVFDVLPLTGGLPSGRL